MCDYELFLDENSIKEGSIECHWIKHRNTNVFLIPQNIRTNSPSRLGGLFAYTGENNREQLSTIESEGVQKVYY